MVVFKRHRLLQTFTFRTSEFFQTKCKKSSDFSRHFEQKSITFFYVTFILLYLRSIVPIKSKYITQSSTIIPTM